MPNICDQCGGTPPTPVCDGCLTVGQPIVLPGSSIAPCGESGGVAIQYLGCDTAIPIFTVLSHDPELTNVSFTDNNLTYDSTADAVAGRYYKIRYKALCVATGYEVQGVAHIGIKDLCAEVTCTGIQSCDKCDGICKDDCSDLEAGSTSAKKGTDIIIQ